MSEAVSSREILNGKIFPIMMKIGWPIMVAMALDTVYQLVDTFWLGRLPGLQGGNAVAGLQISFPVIWFFMSFQYGFGMAGMAMVSQYSGAKDRKKVNFAAGQVISLSIITSILMTVVGIVLVPHLVPLVTDIKPLSDAATLYLKIYFLGLPFMFITGILRSLLSATGDTITPMKVTVFTNVINLLLDPVFIFGVGPIPGMGIAGAGIATVISIFLSAVVFIYILASRKKNLRVRMKHLVPMIKWYKQVFKIGIPAAIGTSVESFGFLLLLAIIARLPDARDVLGGFGVGFRIINFAFIALFGLTSGLTVIIGQNLGANRIDRVKSIIKQGTAVLFLIVAGEMALLILFRTFLLSVFIPNEAGMIAQGAQFLLYFGPAIPLFGIIEGISAAFNAAGKTVPPLIYNSCRLWAFRLPLGYLFGFLLNGGAVGVWIGMSLSNVLSLLLAVVIFLQGGWKKGFAEIKIKR